MKPDSIRLRWAVAGAAAVALTLTGCPKDEQTGKPRVASLSAKDWQQRRDKVDTLAEARSPETLAKIVSATKDPHPKVREAAVKALARRNDRSIVPVLARCVKDSDPAVRQAAVRGLQQYTGERAVSVVLLRLGTGTPAERQLVRRVLGQQLRGSKAPVRAAAARRLAIMVKAERSSTAKDAAGALVALGKPAVGPVLETLAAVRPGSEGPWVSALRQVLARMGGEAVYPLIKALREAGENPVRARAATSALAVVGKPAVDLLVRTLDRTKEFSLPAVDLAERALVWIGAAAVPFLVDQLKSSLPDQRLAALELLGRIGHASAVSGLSALLAKEKNRTLRLAAVRALGVTRAPAAVTPVLTALRGVKRRGKLDSADWAAYREALISLKTPAQTVRTLLADRLPHVRLVGAQVAGRLRSPGAGPLIAKLVRDRSPAVAAAAARAAGELGVKAAGSALRRQAYSKNRVLRRHVLTALGRIGDRKALGVLLAGLRYRRSYAIQAAAAIALGRLKVQAAKRPLGKLRRRGSFALRESARWAYAQLQGGSTQIPPTLCGLIVKYQATCVSKAPEADLGVDLQTLCRHGSAARLENVVRASTCRQLDKVLRSLAVVKGGDLFVSHWAGKKKRKRAEIRFRAGVRQGRMKRWHPSGKPEAQGVLHRGRRHGLWRFYWPSGKRSARGRYHAGKYHGSWKHWYASGVRRSSGRYRYGKPRATWTEYHPNGKRALVLRYKAGKAHGKAESYYADGKPSSRTTFVAGRRHGAWRTFFPTGKPRSTGAYHQGKRHGPWTWFHEGGKPREKGTFDKGKKTGTWTVWNSNGEVVEKCTYPADGLPRCTQ